jgi:hypothetical protein
MFRPAKTAIREEDILDLSIEFVSEVFGNLSSLDSLIC